jgi:hypothetical protein
MIHLLGLRFEQTAEELCRCFFHLTLTEVRPLADACCRCHTKPKATVVEHRRRIPDGWSVHPDGSYGSIYLVLR